jgi:hypothetical protein
VIAGRPQGRLVTFPFTIRQRETGTSAPKPWKLSHDRLVSTLPPAVAARRTAAHFELCITVAASWVLPSQTSARGGAGGESSGKAQAAIWSLSYTPGEGWPACRVSGRWGKSFTCAMPR